MGIKLFNSFLKNKFKHLIQRKHWDEFYKKKIVIDTNNYIYEFLSEENLVNGFIKMCEIFLKYKINPLFVFDGKPTEEKTNEIKNRKICRLKSKIEYDNNYVKLSEKNKKELRRKFVKVTVVETAIVKELLDFYNMSYIQAPNESDELCCKLVNIGKVFACLSNDMDMFIYGCKRIIRNYNSKYQTIDYYDFKNIKEGMNISLVSFKYLSILSNLKNNIYNNYQTYCNYKDNDIKSSFLQYLLDEDIILKNEFINIENTYKFYDLKNSNVLNKCRYVLIKKPCRTFSINYIKRKLGKY